MSSQIGFVLSSGLRTNLEACKLPGETLTAFCVAAVEREIRYRLGFSSPAQEVAELSAALSSALKRMEVEPPLPLMYLVAQQLRAGETVDKFVQSATLKEITERERAL